ncbi:MAG: phosphoglycerate dehydrogenase [Sedimentisphaeraceae bacterium JB056]
MYKILISDKLAQEGIDLINNTDGFEAVVNTGLSEDELSSIIGDYDGLIIRSATQVTPKVLENSGKLKGVARAGVGVDNINIPEATRAGVLVMNTPGGNTLSAAEHTMALMLSMSRNVVPACNSMKEGKWDRKSYMGNQLNNKTIGVIGLGRIGMAVVRMALGFNMNVLGYDPFAVPEEAKKLGISVTDDLNDIYQKSDFISLHVPRNKDTENMIDKAQLEMMKPTTRIVNCARGGIINENALYDALEAGVIAGAALDVFPTEPPKNTRFENIANCLVTPHLGASTEEAQIEVAVEAAQILMDAIKGGPIKNALNAPAMGDSMPKQVVAYAALAGKIGSLMSSMLTGRVKSIDLTYLGDIASLDVSAVTTAFNIALLQPNFDSPVNIVNVGFLAKERGITTNVTTSESINNLSSSFTAKVTTEKGSHSVTGTVFDGNILKVVSVDGYDAEFTPEGTLMMLYYEDRPGVIGAIGTACGKSNINIGTMSVGRGQGKALMVVSLDQSLCEDTNKELDKLDYIDNYIACSID